MKKRVILSASAALFGLAGLSTAVIAKPSTQNVSIRDNVGLFMGVVSGLPPLQSVQLTTADMFAGLYSNHLVSASIEPITPRVKPITAVGMVNDDTTTSANNTQFVAANDDMTRTMPVLAVGNIPLGHTTESLAISDMKQVGVNRVL